VTVAGTALNVSVFCEGVLLKPVPDIVTVVAIGPLEGVNCTIPTVPAECRSTASRLPTASYT
jgi:hypothetical protein